MSEARFWTVGKKRCKVPEYLRISNHSSRSPLVEIALLTFFWLPGNSEPLHQRLQSCPFHP